MDRKEVVRLLWLFVAAIVVVTVVVFRVGAPSKPKPAATGPRLVSLAPNLTETLFALGAGDQVVGVTNYCNYPPEATAKEKVGDFINPSIERIVSLKPDLVLAERWNSSRVSRRLSQLGIRVVETISPSSVAEVYQLIREVGAVTGRQDEAARLVADMRGRIEAARSQAARFAFRPTVYVEIDPPAWTVGKRSYTSEAVSLAGGKNLFDDVDRPALLVSKEKIIARDPAVILSFSAKAAEVAARPGWEQIRAVREKRIIDDFNRDLLSRGTVRLADGIEQLMHRLEKMQPSLARDPAKPAGTEASR